MKRNQYVDLLFFEGNNKFKQTLLSYEYSDYELYPFSWQDDLVQKIKYNVCDLVIDNVERYEE